MLSGQVHESEVGLGSASSRISRLNEIVKQNDKKITSLEEELTSSRTLADRLKVRVIQYNTMGCTIMMTHF